MNIFVLDECPQKAAQYCNDRHCSKMIIESAQMLANAYSLERLSQSDCPRTQKGNPRKHSYVHHPCSKWAIKSLENWKWLLAHSLSLCQEYKFRFNKKHFTEDFIMWCQQNHPKLPQNGLTIFALAMPDDCIDKNPVIAYRTYYNKEKRHLAKWTKRAVPYWWIE